MRVALAPQTHPVNFIEEDYIISGDVVTVGCPTTRHSNRQFKLPFAPIVCKRLTNVSNYTLPLILCVSVTGEVLIVDLVGRTVFQDSIHHNISGGAVFVDGTSSSKKETKPGIKADTDDEEEEDIVIEEKTIRLLLAGSDGNVREYSINNDSLSDCSLVRVFYKSAEKEPVTCISTVTVDGEVFVVVGGLCGSVTKIRYSNAEVMATIAARINYELAMEKSAKEFVFNAPHVPEGYNIANFLVEAERRQREAYEAGQLKSLYRNAIKAIHSRTQDGEITVFAADSQGRLIEIGFEFFVSENSTTPHKGPIVDIVAVDDLLITAGADGFLNLIQPHNRFQMTSANISAVKVTDSFGSRGADSFGSRIGRGAGLIVGDNFGSVSFISIPSLKFGFTSIGQQLPNDNPLIARNSISVFRDSKDDSSVGIVLSEGAKSVYYRLSDIPFSHEEIEGIAKRLKTEVDETPKSSLCAIKWASMDGEISNVLAYTADDDAALMLHYTKGGSMGCIRIPLDIAKEDLNMEADLGKIDSEVSKETVGTTTAEKITEDNESEKHSDSGSDSGSDGDESINSDNSEAMSDSIAINSDTKSDGDLDVKSEGSLDDVKAEADSDEDDEDFVEDHGSDSDSESDFVSDFDDADAEDEDITRKGKVARHIIFEDSESEDEEEVDTNTKIGLIASETPVTRYYTGKYVVAVNSSDIFSVITHVENNRFIASVWAGDVMKTVIDCQKDSRGFSASVQPSLIDTSSPPVVTITHANGDMEYYNIENGMLIENIAVSDEAKSLVRIESDWSVSPCNAILKPNRLFNNKAKVVRPTTRREFGNILNQGMSFCSSEDNEHIIAVLGCRQWEFPKVNASAIPRVVASTETNVVYQTNIGKQLVQFVGDNTPDVLVYQRDRYGQK